jgi:hypothetical protein
VSDRDAPDRLLGLDELVDDPVCPDVKRAESPQPPAQGAPGQRLALEQTERVLHGIDDGPVELEHLVADAASEDDVRHGSAASAPLVELGAHAGEAHDLPA